MCFQILCQSKNAINATKTELLGSTTKWLERCTGIHKNYHCIFHGPKCFTRNVSSTTLVKGCKRSYTFLPLIQQSTKGISIQTEDTVLSWGTTLDLVKVPFFLLHTHFLCKCFFQCSQGSISVGSVSLQRFYSFFQAAHLFLLVSQLLL